MPRAKTNKPDYWDDFGGRLSDAEKIASEFFSEAEAITTIQGAVTSEFDLSDEEKTEETVAVRFGSDGFAYAVEASDEETDSIKTRRKANEIVSEPLDVVPQKHKQGATEWAHDFSEVIARLQEFACVTKLSAIRWVHGGDGKKVSPLPSPVDFLADTDLVAKRALTPALYRVFHEIWFENLGEGALRVPEVVQIYIQRICVAGWKKAGLLPFGRYWSQPSPESKLGTAVNLAAAIQEEQRREQQQHASKARRKVLRKVRREKARNAETITALKVAA